MTTVELLAYCRAQEHQPFIPDLVWQRGIHRNESIGALCDNGFVAPNGFHDTRTAILETRNWLLATEHTYATVLFTEDTACSKPQK